MNCKLTTLTASIALMFAAAMPAQAQTAKEFEELRAEMRKLRAELDALKSQKQESSNAALADRVEQVELRAKDAVVLGDIPNSFRLPNSDTSVRVYGFAELTAVKEFKGDNSDQDYSTFLPYAPLEGTPQGNRKGRTYLTGRTSRIGIEAATPSPYGPIGMKIEGDFNNDPRTGNSAVYGTTGNIYTQQATNSYNFRLRHAYGQFGGLLAGQTWSTFMDLDSLPETVDFNGPIGATFIRQPQVRYTYPMAGVGNFTVALENSVSYVLDNTATATPAGFSRVPDLIGRFDKGFDWGTLSLRALSHEHRIDDGAGVNLSRRGWGVAASGMVKTVGNDFLTWTVTGGNGIGRYFNYIEGAFYDAGTNRILMEKAAGIVLGYQHKPSDTLRYNFALGYQKNFTNEYTDFAVANGLDSGRFGINRKLWQAHLGFIWNPVKGVDIGTEYILGRRTTLAGEDGDMSRINFSAKYNFN
ncbi:MAG TPA: DcaP family trimeric outer membrane transporter [Noviherbaspirillum sp.]|uniref:DcaP family trimeric outer membrane transporter n=1 Tax=Noviherbaspirillum sp. TaxID=1926288 RepID=UPI002D6D5CD7|nr:DcaP family trimeric outer membrane transporter [Noviherbaspirillum sp.]HYD96831.1 DcaP family trimeric outer membrane transporter [Noviherbaspirillum sp.]